MEMADKNAPSLKKNRKIIEYKNSSNKKCTSLYILETALLHEKEMSKASTGTQTINDGSHMSNPTKRRIFIKVNEK